MPLSLVVGPAHSGKVALLLERFLEAIDADPWLVVPTRGDIARVEKDLLRRSPALLAGRIGTFDDLFAEIAGQDDTTVGDRPRRAAACCCGASSPEPSSAPLSRSAATRGFADALGGALAELGAALVEPERVEGDLGRLGAAYRDRARRLRLSATATRSAAAPSSASAAPFDAWDARPVLAYGFEDLTAAEWALVEALAARVQVTVSLPYEPARAVFASLRRTADDLARLAPRSRSFRPAATGTCRRAIAHVERALFSDGRRRPARSTASSGSSREQARAARPSWSATRSSRRSAPASRPRRSRSSSSRSTAGARRSTPSSRATASPTSSTSRCGCPRPPSVVRCSRSCASPGVAARARELFALPALAVRRPRAARRRLRRGAPARARRARGRPGDRGGREDPGSALPAARLGAAAPSRRSTAPSGPADR